jgi:hypothetical protein
LHCPPGWLLFRHARPDAVGYGGSPGQLDDIPISVDQVQAVAARVPDGEL